MKPLSKIPTFILIMALVVSNIAIVNSVKVNAADSGSGSARGRITVWCYYMRYYTVDVYNETGYCVDDFYVWNLAIGHGGPVVVDFSCLDATNGDKYYSVDKLYTIKVFEDYSELVYTTYAHGGDEITISHQNGWSTCQGKVPSNSSSEPSATNSPSSKPTYPNLTPYTSPPTSSAQTDNSVANGLADSFSFGEFKIGFGALLFLVVVSAVVGSLVTLGVTRRIKRQ